tara:strand:+ start:202 stop:873 length:672 start_codon:yes stop_codon:yes gene_type:complete
LGTVSQTKDAPAQSSSSSRKEGTTSKTGDDDDEEKEERFFYARNGGWVDVLSSSFSFRVSGVFFFFFLQRALRVLSGDILSAFDARVGGVEEERLSALHALRGELHFRDVTSGRLDSFRAFRGECFFASFLVGGRAFRAHHSDVLRVAFLRGVIFSSLGKRRKRERYCEGVHNFDEYDCFTRTPVDCLFYASRFGIFREADGSGRAISGVCRFHAQTLSKRCR